MNTCGKAENGSVSNDRRDWEGENNHCFRIREEVDKLLIRLMHVFIEDVMWGLYNESDQTQILKI